MVFTTSISYPHGVTVIGKSTIKQSNPNILTRNSFQLWLNKNYIADDNINLGISMLNEKKEVWEAKAKKYGITKTYEEHLDMLELFSGKTIEIIVGR